MAGGLDHLVVVARDLDAQAELYRRLGFQVGARNRHAWGTLNHIVQFDGSFLELLTTEESFQRPPIGAPVGLFVDTVVDYLEAREGLAMMVLEGHDADADHRAFNAAGIGAPETFYFARQGYRPDGGAVEVAFSLAFAKAAGVEDAGLFVCQQHAPEMFWNKSFQMHENGATGIARIGFASPAPHNHADFFAAYTGCAPADVEGGLRFQLARGAVDVLTPAHCAGLFGASALPESLDTPRFAAIEFHVEDSARIVAKLLESDMPYEEIGGRVVVPARAAMGVTLAFSGATKAKDLG